MTERVRVTHPRTAGARPRPRTARSEITAQTDLGVAKEAVRYGTEGLQGQGAVRQRFDRGEVVLDEAHRGEERKAGVVVDRDELDAASGGGFSAGVVGDIAGFARPLQLLGEVREFPSGRHFVKPADSHVDRMDFAAAEQRHQSVARLFEL